MILYFEIGGHVLTPFLEQVKLVDANRLVIERLLYRGRGMLMGIDR